MKNTFITSLILIALSIGELNAQHLPTETLWKAISYYDTLGHKKNRRIDEFIYFENKNNIGLLRVDELINMADGSMMLNYMVEGLNTKEKNGRIAIEDFQNQFLELKDDTLVRYTERYWVKYVKADVTKSKVSVSEFKDVFLNKKVQMYYSDGEISKQKRIYKTDGFVTIESSSTWDQVYRIFDFFGYTFLKSPVSPCKIVTDVKGKSIHAVELDHRFEDRNFVFKEAD